MRLFYGALLCASALSVHANVIQYFAGISYNNPSELFKVKKYQFILGDTLSYADLRFTGNALNFNTFTYGSGINHSRTFTSMPYGRAAKRLNKKLVFAVDVTQPFNSNLNWGNTAFTRYAVTQNYLRDVDISPKISYSMNKKLQLGAGINFNYVLNNEINWAYPTSPTTYGILTNPTHSFGVGYNLGLTYLFDKSNFLSLTYYSRIRQNTQGISRLGNLINPNLNLSFFMPATTILGYTHIFNKYWLISLQGFLSQWDVNQEVRVNNTAVPPPNQNFRFDLSFSKSYALQAALRAQMNKKLGLAFVGMIDDGPEKNHLRTIVFPSATQYLVGLAADYHFNKHTTLELLAAHVFSWPSINNRVIVDGISMPFTTGAVNINVEVLDLRLKVEF
ncbi:MAG: outer membrane protein transport protein [Legionella sp.]|nr:outer membrane protein transport protein [Legionella sp.]